MALSKRVCKSCFKDAGHVWKMKIFVTMKDDKGKEKCTTMDADELWSRGQVFCPWESKDMKYSRLIKEPTPDYCPFALEHLMIMQEV